MPLGASTAIERYSQSALSHWRQSGSSVGASGIGCDYAETCSLCRAGWALDLHPEWKGVLPIGWKDQVDFAVFFEDIAEPDYFKLQMKRAIRKAPDEFKEMVRDAVERSKE